MPNTLSSSWMVIYLVSLLAGVAAVVVGSRIQDPDRSQKMVSGGYLAIAFALFFGTAEFFNPNLLFLTITLLSGVAKFIHCATRKKMPSLIQKFGELFNILMVISVVRFWIVEPQKIPSSSMRPGLVVGDFILVDKFSFGLRSPFNNQVVFPVGAPQRGDVVVFQFPVNRSINYIKRVIGLPGDTVVYRNKQILINAKPVASVPDGLYLYTENNGVPIPNNQTRETLGSHQYNTLFMPAAPAVSLKHVLDFPNRDLCQYEQDGFSCTVPPGHYFMMGDNRDHSADSRYWGFVPEQYLVGKVMRVAVNFKALSRIGKAIE